MTGTFVDGPVEGVNFATATQSGVTDTAGTFRYVGGESITFSLGGTTIGEPVPATTMMTPADLVPPLALPTTSAQAASLLRNLSAPEAIAFSRFLNMLIFLQSLDADRSPDNGITIPDGIAALLVGIQIDFDADLSSPDSGFPALMAQATSSELLDSAAIEKTGRALDHFFASQGISVTVSRLYARETDTDLDGLADSVTVYGYDADGNRTTVARDDGHDGIIDQLDTFSFDANGNELIWLFDADGDGPAEEITARILTYDANGCLLSRTFDRLLSGTLDRHRTYERTANCKTLAIQVDNDMDGTVESVLTFVYDDQGGWIENEDSNGDGVTDGRVQVMISVEPDGSRTRVENLDGNADDVIDDIFIESFDAHGNRTGRHADFGADGILDVSETWTFTYNSNGFLIQSTGDQDGNGSVDLSTAYIYDADGILIAEEIDVGANGSVDSRTTLVYEPGNWHSFFSY